MKKIMVFLTIISLTLLNLINIVSADIGDYANCGMGMMYGNYGTGMMAFGWIFSLLLLIALILFIIWLVKQINKK